MADFFPTQVYSAQIGGARLRDDLLACCLSAAADDAAGQRWSRKHGYPGYTSYASLNDLPWRFPPMQTLARHVEAHAARFARELEWDLGGGRLAVHSLWINVLDPGGFHSGHIHPLSQLSGTYYVSTPDGASAIRFEDPRLPLMMAAPPKKPRAKNRSHISIAPKPGQLLLWESWLRHEVPLNAATDFRISISFNLGLSAEPHR